MTSPRCANWGKFSNKKLSKKCDFRFKNIKKTESPKMTSKVLYELLIRSYERFKYFWQTWNLTISKSTSVNQWKCEHNGKINFSSKRSKKCNIQKCTQVSSTSSYEELWAIHVFFTNLKFDNFQKQERKAGKILNIMNEWISAATKSKKYNVQNWAQNSSTNP